MIITLLILFIILQFLDGLTTYKVLSKGGVELNPVLNKIFSIFGWIPSLVVIKLIAIAAGIWMYANQQVEVLIALNLIYAYVVLHNFRQMNK